MHWIFHCSRGKFGAGFILSLFLSGISAAGAQQPAAQQLPDSPAAIAATTVTQTASGPAADSDQSRQSQAPAAQTGFIAGAVLDAYGDLIEGATVTLEDGTAADKQTVEANTNGAFQFSGVKPGVAWRVTVSGKNFMDWKSPQIVLKPGEFYTLTGIALKLAEASTSVTVYADSAQIATEQVQVEYKQKVLGFIPNYYVVYDQPQGQSIAPLTTKLKFQMAMKLEVNPVTIAGSAFLAAVSQASDSAPDYRQGWKGYAQRVGANYADGFTDILFGGAILPSLLHQDPRYYYQGTGTTASRLKHALAYPFFCKSDSGKTEPNYSTIGGDLISASLSNIYYPTKDRGAGLLFTNFAIGTAERGLSTVLQEFVIRKLTPSARKQDN